MSNNDGVIGTLRPCPVCRCGQAEVLHHQRFTLPEGHLLGEGYDVVSCSSCCFVYADTAAKQADYDRFYAQLSRYESSVSSGGGASPQDSARLHETAAAVASALPSKDARILDFGCAGGGLLRALRDLGYTNLHGIDPSPACADQVRAAPGIPADVGSLFDIPPGLGEFDAIMLTHVLEHVEDVRGGLENLLALLAPGGLLYLEVPDAARYADFILAPFQDFNTEHINHFSARGLDNACAVVGLEPVGAGHKVFDVAAKMPFPATFGFWRKGASAAPRPLQPDRDLRPRIEDYIARSRAIMERYDARISELLTRSPEVVVWGTGQLTLKLLHETSLGGARIAAFVDSNPVNQGQRLHGAPILAPDAIAGSQKPILVASTIHFQAISDTIREKFGREIEIVGLD